MEMKTKKDRKEKKCHIKGWSVATLQPTTLATVTLCKMYGDQFFVVSESISIVIDSTTS